MKKISADRVKLALTLFLSYLKIGLFTFGGGYAMIALIEREFVVRRKWINEVELYEIIAIAESTPGPIAINCATFVGYKILGFVGSFLATLAVCIPSFVIIYLISVFYDAFMALTAVAYAFEGIKVGIAIMITTAGINMLRKGKKNAFAIGVFLITFAAAVCIDIFSLNFSTVYIILSGAALGIIAQIIKDIINKKRGKGAGKECPDATDGSNDGKNNVRTGMASTIICRDGRDVNAIGGELNSVEVEKGGDIVQDTNDADENVNTDTFKGEKEHSDEEVINGLTDTGGIKDVLNPAKEKPCENDCSDKNGNGEGDKE